MDRLLRARACAPNASHPSVKAQSSVSPLQKKKIQSVSKKMKNL
jgi:hypothetical protein